LTPLSKVVSEKPAAGDAMLMPLTEGDSSITYVANWRTFLYRIIQSEATKIFAFERSGVGFRIASLGSRAIR
jgi:hypothetical protein